MLLATRKCKCEPMACANADSRVLGRFTCPGDIHVVGGVCDATIIGRINSKWENINFRVERAQREIDSNGIDKTQDKSWIIYFNDGKITCFGALLTYLRSDWGDKSHLSALRMSPNERLDGVSSECRCGGPFVCRMRENKHFGWQVIYWRWAPAAFFWDIFKRNTIQEEEEEELKKKR